MLIGGQTDGRTLERYYIIPRHCIVAGHQNVENIVIKKQKKADNKKLTNTVLFVLTNIQDILNERDWYEQTTIILIRL